jgi:hypothetical protein
MKRVPVNLASNPIEHRLWVRRVKLVAVAAALIVTALHALAVWGLLDTPETAAPDTRALNELRYWGDEVAQIAANADPRAAQRTAVSVGLANALIDQRVFPWSGLFAMLEQTLPEDVRLEIIQPITTIDGVRLTLTAASASEEALLEFLGALEGRPELIAVYPGRQQVGPDGDLRLSVEAIARIPDAKQSGGASEEPRP